MHVRKHEVDENEVDKMLTIVRAGTKQRGNVQKRKGRRPQKGKPKKWCPVPVCNQLLLDLGRHLCHPNVHSIAKGSREYQRLLKMAKVYTGLSELQDSLTAPPPAIVEIFSKEAVSATSAAASINAAAGPPAASVLASPLPLQVPLATPLLALLQPVSASATPSPAASSNALAGPAAAVSTDGATASATLESLGSDAESAASSDESEDDQDQSSDITSHRGAVFHGQEPADQQHKWLMLFYDYQSTPSAGDKKQPVRLQHSSQMRILLEEINLEGDDILCLLGHEGDAVWRLWVKPHLTAATKNPGTLILYLTSYEKFLHFVTHERFNKKAPALHPSHIDDFATVLRDLRGWRSTVGSKSYHVKNKRVIDETEGLLTLDELARIKKSSCYNNAIRLLVLAGQGKELSSTKFVLVRDFLLTRFSLDTGTRPGPLNNATMDEYLKGKVDNGCKVMLVTKHKRAKDGPAICPMLPELHNFMEVYRHYIRPHFARPDEQALFLTNEGIGFREGTIGRRLTFFVERCGVNLAARMAFVDMRKLITTEMLNRCSPEEQAILRRSEKTSR